MKHKIDIDLDTLPKKVQDFIAAEIGHCDANNVQVWLSATRSVDFDEDTKTQVNGYFNEVNEKDIKNGYHHELVCSCGKPLQEWLKLFVHESCHKDQFLEQDPAYCGTVDGIDDPYEKLDQWANASLPIEQGLVKRLIMFALNLELNCERRAVQKIIEQDLPIKVEDYIRRANAYVYFYHVYGLTRQWYTIGKEPYNIPEVLAIVPTTLDNDYTVLPDEIRNAMLKYCYGM